MYNDPGKRSNEDGRADLRPLTEGWLIERFGAGDSERRFLQIGTGQWCGAPYATLFPLRRTAMIYAAEFGFAIGSTARIIRYRKCGKSAFGD